MINISGLSDEEASDFNNLPESLNLNLEQIDNNLSAYSGHDYIRIFSCNIRSCRKNFSQLQTFLNSLMVTFSIIILVETWLSESTDVMFQLNGFDVFNLFRNDNGGGIKVYITHQLKASVINELTFMQPHLECMFLKIKAGKSLVKLGAVYRPPNTSPHKFNTDLLSILNKVCITPNVKRILAGDINFNLQNPLNRGYINDFICNLASLSFLPHVTIPTRLSLENPVTKSSVLDHIWSNLKSHVLTAVITQLNSHSMYSHVPTYPSN